MLKFIPGNITTQSFNDLTSSSSCTLASDKVIACVDEFILFTLINGENARCVTGGNKNMGGWVLLETYVLNNAGRYSRSQNFNEASNWQLAAVCQEKDGSLCRTNTLNIEIINCDDSGDEESGGEDYSSYSCGLSSWCYAGTCPTGWACEQVTSLTATWCACISGSEVHPYWKPDGDGYNPSTCSDTDTGQSLDPIYIKGTCTDKYGYSFIDYCETTEIGGKRLVEYSCSSDGYCIETKIYCPYMTDACTDGACWYLE